MIVQMKKVSIVVLNNERKSALKQLKKVGVVHLEELEGSGEKLAGFKENSNNAMTAVSILSEIKLPKKHKKPESLTSEQAVLKCQEVISLFEEKKRLFEEISNDSVELDRFSDWGKVNPEDFKFLSEKNISLRMFEIPEEKYKILPDSISTVCVNKSKKIVRFLLINGGSERPEEFPPEAYEINLPEYSTDFIQKRIDSDNDKIKEIDSKLKENAIYVSEIKKLQKLLESDIQFETIYSGMSKEETGKSSDLAWISGFVPVDSVEKLKSAVKENSWGLAISDPTDEDNVPTKLKNNKFVSLIYPLTDFLGTVPGYHEYDISGWFLIFFTIFFGMIFGDGGYGLLVTVAALIMILKGISSKKGVSKMAGLMFLLGLSTVVWGTVTCTWFGLTPEQLPSWLVNLSLPPISNAFSDVKWIPFWRENASLGTLTTAQNLQIFCFTLALLQLSVAHFKGIAKNLREKSLKALGELGSLLQLFGMFYVVLSMVVSSQVFGFGEIIFGIPVGTVSIGLIGFGFALSFVFSNYEGKLGESIMASVKGIISVLLGVVNVFSDIVSYIRLWAVGLAGAAISNTVNTMAGPLLGHALTFIAFVALICFGHGLNMILNLLSVIVHGVRLNTLEFSSHLGMSWSGFKYNPFSEKEVK